MAMVREFSEDAIINNESIPNDKNEIAIETTTWSFLVHIRDEANACYGRSFLSIFRKNDDPELNPSVDRISNQVAVDLAKRLDIANESAFSVVRRIIPSIINKIRNQMQDPLDHDFDLNNLLLAFKKDS